MKAVLILIIGLSLFQNARADATADQNAGTQERLEMKRRVLELFDEEKFDELEHMAEECRAQKLRFREGWWKLAYLYDKLGRQNVSTSRDEWKQVLEVAQRWRDLKPQSITARIVLANAWARFAWWGCGGSKKGDGTVEEKQFFGERLAKARKILEEAELLPVKDPELYHVVQVVALGEGWPREQYETLFRKAFALEPTYYSFYYAKTEYLMPQWYGKPGEVEAFASQAARSTRDQEGETMYTTVARTAYGLVPEGEFFRKYEFSWRRIKQGFGDFNRRYPNSLMNLHVFCHMACDADDRETARRLFDQIGSNFLEMSWKNEGQFEQWKRWSKGEAESPK